MQITITNKYHKGATGEYIGRGSPLGNPYSHMPNTKAEHRVETRGKAIEAYEIWLDQQIDQGNEKVLGELTRLFEMAQKGPLKLLCFCAPLPCHGEVIRTVLLRAREA